MKISQKQNVLLIRPTNENSVDNILLINNEKNLLASFKDYGFIYIYNLITFEIISKIKFPNENKSITYNIQLKDKRLAHSSHDKNIYITKQNSNNEYFIDEILSGHDGIILKVIELKNEDICSCSHDSTIKIWGKNINNKFILKYNLKDSNEKFYSVLQISENIITSASKLIDNEEERYVKFWKINEKKSFNFINSKSITLWNNCFIQINKNYFGITGLNQISIIFYENEKSIKTNIFKFYENEIEKPENKIEEPFVKYINNELFFSFGNILKYHLRRMRSIFKLKNNNFLVSDIYGDVYELKFENETFKIIDIKKEMAFEITSFVELNNGTLITASLDGSIKVYV
jgi:hypothetical protein